MAVCAYQPCSKPPCGGSKYCSGKHRKAEINRRKRMSCRGCGHSNPIDLVEVMEGINLCCHCLRVAQRHCFEKREILTPRPITKLRYGMTFYLYKCYICDSYHWTKYANIISADDRIDQIQKIGNALRAVRFHRSMVETGVGEE